MTRLILPSLFVLCALPVLLFLALRVPTGEVPDEVAHIVRVESLRYGEIVGHRRPRLDHMGQPTRDSGVSAHAALLGAGFTFTPGSPIAERVLTRAREATLAAIPWNDAPEFISVPNTAVYFPVFYVPAAVAMQVAKWRGAGPWSAIKAARVANVAAYMVIGLAALLAARRLQGLMFAVLLLPVSLWVAASCNQDGLLIATSVLAAGLLTRGTLGSWWAAALAIGVICAVKPLYLPLAGVVALTLPGRGAMLPLRAAGVVVAAVPALIWYGIAQYYAVVPFVRGDPYAAGPNWFGAPGQMFGTVDAAVQLQVLLHRPALLVTLPIDTLRASWDWLLWEMIGILGVLDILLPAWLYALWLWSLGALAVGESLSARRGPGPVRLWIPAAILACVGTATLALFIGQYLSWTRTGWAAVEGMQGRYFVPLLPFLALALPALAIPGAAWGRWALRAPAAAAGLSGLAVIPALVVATYYLR